MTRNRLILLAAGGSALLMLGALGFQHLGGMHPCKLCIWQRWPHVIAMAIGVLALMIPGRILPAMGALAALTTAGFGGYHAGVENGWWEGPASCTSSSISGLSADELFDKVMAAPVVRCDEIAWQMMGLSMAGWNMVLALVLAVLWLAAARQA